MITEILLVVATLADLGMIAMLAWTALKMEANE